MHLVLKQETTRPASNTFLQQQERFDRFVQVYNRERPHEALNQQTPSTLYQPSTRRYPEELAQPEYPLHDETRTVTSSGHVQLWGRSRHVYLCEALIGERVGLREIGPGQWLVTFMSVDMGIVDVARQTLKPLPPPAQLDPAGPPTVGPPVSSETP